MFKYTRFTVLSIWVIDKKLLSVIPAHVGDNIPDLSSLVKSFGGGVNSIALDNVKWYHDVAIEIKDGKLARISLNKEITSV